jgi:hypothetical protein
MPRPGGRGGKTAGGEGADKAGTDTKNACFLHGRGVHPNRAASSAVNAREARQRALSGFFCGERYQGTGVLQTALSAHEARTFRGSVGPLVVGAHVGADDFCCGDFAFDVARQRLRRVDWRR